MKFPVDDTMLTAWSTLLGLTDQQRDDVLGEIEATLRRGYTLRPLAIRHLSFEQATADMDPDELALIFLETGLRRAGHPDAADAVLRRGLLAQLHAAHAD
ncbi:hypothetical protein K7472_08165 [Streptomyces sp. PTM05]|uniref:Uncharacterized protein n=1 Tax=Streptantibioticus parmotrematis TaxID=2873249 RepID=A0ABS7QR18_9ACTN|nr:hypothetical protein [Streptantibioticus parmotrematis]MBY8884820.1 hypothetical protein [Streptantibioticus parmotrematis]